MHDPQSPGWSQVVFDSAEAVQDALGLQAGCEDALRAVLDPILAGHLREEGMVIALIDSMAHWRARAVAEVRSVQQISFG